MVPPPPHFSNPLCLFFYYVTGDYAWNRTSEPLPENVRRTVSWVEVDYELQAILDADNNSNGGGGSTGVNGHGHTASTTADPKAGSESADGNGVTADFNGVKTPVGVEKNAEQSQREEGEAEGPGGRDDSQVRPWMMGLWALDAHVLLVVSL